MQGSCLAAPLLEGRRRALTSGSRSDAHVVRCGVPARISIISQVTLSVYRFYAAVEASSKRKAQVEQASQVQAARARKRLEHRSALAETQALRAKRAMLIPNHVSARQPAVVVALQSDRFRSITDADRVRFVFACKSHADGDPSASSSACSHADAAMAPVPSIGTTASGNVEKATATHCMYTATHFARCATTLVVVVDSILLPLYT